MSCFWKPTNPTFLEPTLNVFGTSENFCSIFLVFLMIFMLLLCKTFYLKKYFCLPTDPKKYWDISANKTFIFLALYICGIISVLALSRL